MSSKTSCKYYFGEDSLQFINSHFDDSNWIVGNTTPSIKGGQNVVWFRCHVPISEAESDHGLVIDLGRIADEDLTFVNGEEVGSTQMVSELEWPVFFYRNYYVKRDVLLKYSKSEAIVSVRVSSRIDGSMGFLDHSPKFTRTWTHNFEMVFEGLPFGFILVLVVLLQFYPFESSVSRLRQRSLTYLGIALSFMVALSSFVQYRLLFPYSNLLLRGHLIINAIAVNLIFKYLDQILGNARSKLVEIWTLFVCLIAIIIPGIEIKSKSTDWLLTLFGIWGIPLLLNSASMVPIFVKRFKKNPSSGVISLFIGGTLLTLFGGCDLVLLLVGKLPVSLRSSEMGFLAFFVGAMFDALAADRESSVETIQTKYQKASEISVFSKQLGHDLRSPLAALEMLAYNSESLPEKMRVLLRGVFKRISDIAAELMLAEKKTYEHDAKNTASRSTVLLSKIVDSIISEKRLQYKLRIDLEIESDISSENYGIFANVNEMEFFRILSNLIDNSVDAIEKSGKIQVTISKADNGLVSVLVEDNGKGIASEHISKLTNEGFTLGKSNGSGLGLFHAKSVIEKYGGQLTISSEEGNGTQVTILLRNELPPRWFVSSLVLRNNCKVVVLDDDPTIHQIWDARISSVTSFDAKVSIFHFSQADKFREWYSKTQIDEGDVFLIDFELIGSTENGLELIRNLQIEKESILVTSQFGDLLVFNLANELNVSMIPKGRVVSVKLRNFALNLC